MSNLVVARSMARFKRLCCLGLGGSTVMPALIRELHILVPSMRSMFFFADERGGLDHVYTEGGEHAATTQLYLSEFHGRRDREIPGFSFADAMRSQYGVHDLAAMRVDEKAFRRTDFYNALFRPVGRGSDYVRLVMREKNGRGLGMLTTFREPGKRHFNFEEQNRLAGLEPFFVHALRDHHQAGVEMVDSGQSGLIIADHIGNPTFFSPSGRKLLHDAVHPHLSANSTSKLTEVFPAPLRKMCLDLGRVFAGIDIFQAPTYVHHNVLGEFTFRAHLLRGEDPSTGFIGITVTHKEPLPIKLIRRIGEMSLSQRQSEICFMLASGTDYESIADRLGISKHTAIAHGRSIYNRLDVHNRSQLCDKLLH